MRILFTLLSFCFSFSISAQNLSVSLDGNASNAAIFDNSTATSLTPVAPSQWNFGISKLTLSESKYTISHASASGKILSKVTAELFDKTDPSLKSWSFPSGMHIFRENIASFSIFGADGKLINSVNNSSKSPDGEDISELATDDFGRVIVIYNPKINVGSKFNSRAQILSPQYQLKNIYYSNSYQIGSVAVSKSGRLICIVAHDDNRKGEAVLLDKYGKELHRLELSAAMKKVEILEDEKLLVLYSESRIQVYEMFSTKRLASSSLRGEPIIYASYSPSSNVVVALSGVLDTKDFSVSSPKINITDVGRQKLANEAISGTLKVHPNFPLSMTEKSKGAFSILGASQSISVQYK